MTFTDLVQAAEFAAAMATAAGVLIAAWQLRAQKLLERTQFEDSLSQRYQEIARRLPIEAHFGEALDDERFRQGLPDFFAYVDLCNEQVFLRMKGRVRADTWREWREGMRGNLRRPLFAEAWKEIKRRAPESFNELRHLEAAGFAVDPRSWRRLPLPSIGSSD